jgi:hypothetical protein
MSTFKNRISLGLCLFLVSCNSHEKQWNYVAAVESVKQGDRFKIEPLQDTTLVLSGSNFSITRIKFKCSKGNSTESIKFQGAMSMRSSSSKNSIFETIQTDSLSIWPKEMNEKTIEIPVLIVPTFHAYKNKGIVYLYLVDSTKTCISNIISWKVKFK